MEKPIIRKTDISPEMDLPAKNLSAQVLIYCRLKHHWMNILASDMKPCPPLSGSMYAATASHYEEIFDQVYQAYTQDHRHYHTLQHIQDMLAHLTNAGVIPEVPSTATNSTFGTKLSSQARIALLATWFHDVIYEPGQADNEQQSAALAYQLLSRAGLPKAELNQVVNVIQTTKEHHATPCLLTNTIIDADMAVLGSTNKSYQQYRKQVRREYQAIPEKNFNAGRLAFCETLLASPAIYNTQYFQQRYETTARANLASEVRRLNHNHLLK